MAKVTDAEMRQTCLQCPLDYCVDNDEVVKRRGVCSYRKRYTSPSLTLLLPDDQVRVDSVGMPIEGIFYGHVESTFYSLVEE